MQPQAFSQDLIQKARMSRDARFDGLFFIGVKTTGIFCRPICKARAPLEKNVSYYFSAIDAIKEGFRPCLLCRPDSAPGSFAWKGIETTVERGMQLLGQHFELTIEAIAAKLGISTRYFNRLFNDFLQISPKQYQLYQRLLFSKQLLHESGLSIEGVAQASGFTCARQMQIHMKKTTGLTPTQIRKRGKPVTKKEGQTVSVELAYRPPYDWAHVRDFFKLRQVSCNELVGATSIHKVLRIKGEPVLMMAEHNESKHRFEVSFELANLTLLKDSIRATRKMLDLDSDAMTVNQALSDSGLPKEHISNGLRLPGIVDKFEAACRAIVGQQVSVKAAIGQLNLLHEKLLKKGQCLASFVSPKDVANADLSFLKMPQARKDTLKRLAEFMLEFPEAEPQEWLALKGIGPWTVAYVTMRNSAQPDIFLDTDLVIKNKLKALGQQGISLKPEKSAPWRSYLTLSLWNAESLVLEKEPK